jgi:Tfp pilus assembly protein PilN
MSGLKTWLAFGTGVGIELLPDSLQVAIVKVRPSGVDVVGFESIANYRDRPAAEWGEQYLSFLRRHSVAHLAATVLLPLSDVTLRTVTLPGVADSDLEAALRLQIDTLHPYPEDDAAWSWAKLGKTGSLLVGIARRSLVERHIELFTEAGIKISSVTFSAALLHGALRLYGTPPAEGFVAHRDTGRGIEVYGESPSKPLYSSIYDVEWERAVVRAAAELRLPSGFVPREFAALFPSPGRRASGSEDATGTPAADQVPALLAAVGSAVPRFVLPANLLPQAHRSSSSRLIYVPTVALGSLLVAGLIALGLYGRFEDRKYLEQLQAETAVLGPRVQRLQQLDQRIAQSRAYTQLLDAFQARTKGDLDALREATRLIPPPSWVNTLELSRNSLVVAGEADQATGLLRAIDSSPMFNNSEFLVPLNRVGNAEIFRIRASREAGAAAR